MKLTVAALVCILLFSYNVSGQIRTGPDMESQEVPGCGFQESPSFLQLRKQLINKIYQDEKTGGVTRRAAEKYKIPVVVHVIEPDPRSTIATDERIHSAIANLNDAFRGVGIYEDSPDTGIEFELSRYDPNCNETNGITRTDASHFGAYAETGIPWKSSLSDLDKLISWDKESYFNIWVISKFEKNLVGGVGNSRFGIVVPSDNFDFYATTPHEAGHYLGLSHTFPEAAGNCNCADGDGLRDTPELKPFGIDSNCEHESGCEPADLKKINPCTGQAYGLIQKNMMNYTSCMLLFTNDQSNLMRKVLETYHSTLLVSSALSKSQPAESATLSGSSTIFVEDDHENIVRAICSCNGKIEKMTINGADAKGDISYLTPDLPFGGHISWTYGLTCESGLIATKTVDFYRLGISNIQSKCSSDRTYEVTFDNPFRYRVAASAGILSGNTITDIPNTSDVRITVARGTGDSVSTNIGVPCCAFNLIASPDCLPVADNGLSEDFGIDSFKFGNSILKTSLASSGDGANYVDYACTEKATVNVGDVYEIAVKGHSTQKHYVKVYIDYNADGDFTANEIVLNGITTGDENNFLAGTITIPTHITTETRLRVRVLADSDSSSTSCLIKGDISGSGQIEDYSIFVNAFNSRKAIKLSPEAINAIKSKLAVEGKNELLASRIVGGSNAISSDVNSEEIFDSTQIFVSPNPVNGSQFNVTIRDAGQYEIHLLTQKGIEIPIFVTKTGIENQMQINGKSRFVPGLYLLKVNVRTGHGGKVIKILIL